MKKILSYVIVFLSVFIIWNCEASAGRGGRICAYTDGRLSASFTIKSDDTVSRVSIKGEMDSKDETKINNQEPIKNWKADKEGIPFIGINYYESYNSCPPYAIFIDGYHHFEFYVSDSLSVGKFDALGGEHQGHAIMELVEYPSESEDSNGEVIVDSCSFYTNEKDCKQNDRFSCVWVESEYGDYCNVDNLQYVQCANAFDIPHQVPELTSFGINFLKIITPIILIVTSIITLVKALMASKEDEIKKATGTLKRRLIAAALVFFVIYIVQFVIMKVADSSETEDISTCLSCFINNDCQNNIYYKTNVGGTYTCRYLKNKVEFDCPENNE